MRHQRARLCIDAILKRGAFDTPATALVSSCVFSACQAGTEALDDCAFAALADEPVYQPETLDYDEQRLPEDTAELVSQLADLITRHPCWTGRELARLKALAHLWPHASRGERMQLRRLWCMGFNERRAPIEASASRDQLCDWQSRLPTVHSSEPPSAASLSALLDAPDAERAYHELAGHLHSEIDIPGLCWSLGVLAQQVLLHRFDREGLTQSAFIGASVCQDLIGEIPPDTALVLLSQLAHQIWWCRNAAGMRGLKSGNTDYGLSFSAAVRHGDYTASQRAARQSAADCRHFWPQAIAMTVELVEARAQQWPRAILGLTVTGCRCAGQPVAPDDAATLGATLAAIHWLDAPATCRT